MTDRHDDVWATRDFPVLLEVTRRIDQGAHWVRASEIASALEIDEETAQLALAALLRRRLVDKPMGSFGAVGPLGVSEVSGAAYLMTGLHPDGDEALSGLISALRQAADETGDDEERSRLRRAADALGSIGRDLGVGLMTAVISRYATGG